MLTRRDLEAIRRIVREEVMALRGDPRTASTIPLEDEVSDESLREDVQQTIAWMRRERPQGDEYVAAKAIEGRRDPSVGDAVHVHRDIL